MKIIQLEENDIILMPLEFKESLDEEIMNKFGITFIFSDFVSEIILIKPPLKN